MAYLAYQHHVSFMLQNRGMINNNDQGPKSETEDPEIEKIAEQIKKVNTKKMVQVKHSVLISNKTNNSTNPNKTERGAVSDWSSIQGQFGWLEVGTELIPYIMRAREKYVAERIARSKLFFQYEVVFANEIWRNLPIKMHHVTMAEAKLLNEINLVHCDQYYGKEQFTENDKICSLQDVLERYEYLSFCYTKITKQEYSTDQRCGFIKIDKANLVPYVLVDDKKFLPLFYFEGDCEYLEKNTVNLEGWNLVYLKFVCEIQGIRRALYDTENIEVVDLEYVKNLFLPGTEFEVCWKIESLRNHILRPTAEINNFIAEYMKKSVQSKSSSKQYEAKVPITNTRQISTNYHTHKQMHRSDRACRPTFNPNVNSQQRRTPHPYLAHYVRGNTGMRNCYRTSSVQGNRIVSAQTPSFNVPSHRLGSKCYQIPEVEHRNPSQYFLSRKEVDGKLLIGCINMEPFNPAIILVTLEELAGSLFEVELTSIKNAINVMCLELYRPNMEQINILKDLHLSNTEGLIKINSLVENLPQIKYILGLT